MRSNHYTMLVNSGGISAGSLFAIDADGAATAIFNEKGGVITGFVDLTDNADYFTNEAGASFEARLTSDFRTGGDLFENHGRVHTAANAGAAEFTAFIGLETFENSGTISLVDGQVGDVFQISNTVGGTDLDFNANGGSKLAVDAFLGAPGSTADVFVIDGDVTGRTGLRSTTPIPGRAPIIRKASSSSTCRTATSRRTPSSCRSRSRPACSTRTSSSCRREAASSSSGHSPAAAPMSCRSFSPRARTCGTRPPRLGSTAPPISGSSSRRRRSRQSQGRFANTGRQHHAGAMDQGLGHLARPRRSGEHHRLRPHLQIQSRPRPRPRHGAGGGGFRLPRRAV